MELQPKIIFHINLLILKHKMSNHKEKKIIHQPIKFNQVLQFKINQNALNKNFEIIAQALSKINDLNHTTEQHQNQLNIFKSKNVKQQREIGQIFKILQARKPQHDINEVMNKIEQQQRMIRQIKKKQIQTSKNIEQLFDIAKYLDYNEVVKNLKIMNEFVTKKQNDEFVNSIKKNLQTYEENTISKQQFEIELKKYTPMSQYSYFQQKTKIQLNKLYSDKANYSQIKILQEKIKKQIEKIQQISKSNQKMNKKVQQLDSTFRNIDVLGLQTKIKKIKQDFLFQFGGIKANLNSKVTRNQFQHLQKNLNAKLDAINHQLTQNVADKHQTKKALLFLQKRINNIISKISVKFYQDRQDDIEGIFTTTNPLHCASCSANLTKIDTKPKFLPWSNFPARQHQHQKDKVFEAFVEKLAVKKLSEPFILKNHAQQKLELLADAINNLKQRGDNQDANTNRMTNYMQNYGQSGKKSKQRKTMVSSQSKDRKFEVRKMSHNKQRNEQN